MPVPTPADIINLKTVIPSSKNTREWNDVSPEDRADAFTSSEVVDGDVLGVMRDKIYNFLANSRDEKGALKTGSKSDFVHQMQGMIKDMGYDADLSRDADLVTNFPSVSRLELIFKTQVAMARGRSAYAMQMTPRMQRLFPAFRFVRRPGSKVKRPIHEANEDVVRLKSDYHFWADEMNSEDIGGFKLPYTPFGFNSNMDQEPVSARETRDIGLIKYEPAEASEEELAPIIPSHDRKASIAGMSDDIRARLQANLGAKFEDVRIDGDKIVIPQGSPLTNFNPSPFAPLILWGLFAGAISIVLYKRKELTELADKLKAGDITSKEFEARIEELAGKRDGVEELVKTLME